MNVRIILLIIIIATSCGDREQPQVSVYLSNISFEEFDKSIFKVLINDKLILSDTVNNMYISSFPWREHRVDVPRDQFNLKVIVNSAGYDLEKDTTLAFIDSLKVFIRFNFTSRYKRYHNPDIYKFLPKETTRLKEIADSLYANSALANAKEYLNDTIPLRKNIEIEIK